MRAISASRATTRSWFFTGSPPAVFQPLRFQPWIHLVIESSIRRESGTMQASAPSGSERRPSSAAVYSMRLLVVCGAPPESSIGSASPSTTIAAQPPGPGLRRHAPSAQTRNSPSRCSTGVSGLDGGMAGDGTRGCGRLLHARQAQVPGEDRLALGVGVVAPRDVVAGDDDVLAALVEERFLLQLGLADVDVAEVVDGVRVEDERAVLERVAQLAVRGAGRRRPHPVRAVEAQAVLLDREARQRHDQVVRVLIRLVEVELRLEAAVAHAAVGLRRLVARIRAAVVAGAQRGVGGAVLHLAVAARRG